MGSPPDAFSRVPAGSPTPVRAVLGDPDPVRVRAARQALEGAGWDVEPAASPEALRAACGRGDVDVAFVDRAFCSADPELLATLKRRPDSFATAVVLMAPRDTTEVSETLDALGAGAQDVLLYPFSGAEVVARASAAGRTRALVEELLERDERIEELVFVDELTSLYNRRYLLHHTAMLIAGARRHGHELSCLLLDVDRFKQVNDSFGHPVGDDVLRAVARAIRGRLREEDVGGRLGGDEFLILLPDTGATGARTVAEEIRVEVSSAIVPAGERAVRPTVSLGWVTWEGEEADEMIRRADGALYAAKQGGRDRVAAA